jgi:hypothetical protein
MRGVVALLLLAACGAEPGVVPGRGRVGGGEPVRITGEGFDDHGPMDVYFGMRAAKAVVVESGTLIRAVTPQADAPGVVDVSIRFADGTVIDHPAAFEYDEQGLVLRP